MATLSFENSTDGPTCVNVSFNASKNLLTIHNVTHNVIYIPRQAISYLVSDGLGVVAVALVSGREISLGKCTFSSLGPQEKAAENLAHLLFG